MTTTPRLRRTGRVLLLCLIASLVMVVPANAECGAPRVRIDDREPPPINRLTVQGEFFSAGCGETGTGCSGPGRRPMGVIDLELRGPSGTVATTTARPDESFELTASLIIPFNAPPGSYRVVAFDAEATNGDE